MRRPVGGGARPAGSTPPIRPSPPSTSWPSRSWPRWRRPRSGPRTGSSIWCARSAPYAELDRADFDAVLELVSEGITTGRGKRMAYLHRDRVNGVLRPRRGARLAALTSGGAIAEVGDYRVILDPDDTPVGTVNEDFAIESMVGDVFLLGTHSWRIRRVTQGEVRVTDAEGAQPTIPFWVGEAPSRTDELSEEVSTLRGAPWPSSSPMPATARRSPPVPPRWPRDHVERDVRARDRRGRQLVDYLAAGPGRARHRCPPATTSSSSGSSTRRAACRWSCTRPFGGRINRGLGLALRKRFCATFDFELQAAANDDAVVLSLGPQHSFPLDSAPRLLRSETAEGALAQAVLASPMFASRWRWNLNRSLAVLRFRGGQEEPPPHPAHGGRRPHGRRLPRPGRLPGERPGRPGGRSPTTCSSARPCTTACTRPWTSTAWWPCCERHGGRRRSGSTSSSRPSRRSWPTRS